MARPEGTPSYSGSTNFQEACEITGVFGKQGQDFSTRLILPQRDGRVPNREVLDYREKCGVSAYFSLTGENVARILANYAESLKNRGDDSVGEATYNYETGMLTAVNGPGSSSEFFTPDYDFDANGLRGTVGLAHGKYTVSRAEGTDISLGRQPSIWDYSRNGLTRSMAMSFNGNIPDMYRPRLRVKIPSDMPSVPDYDTYDLAQAIVSSPGDDWEEMLYNALYDIPSAYAMSILTKKGRLFGLTCPENTWPLWVGQNDRGIAFASENSVDPSMHWRKVRPGELVEATMNGVKSTQLFEPAEKFCFMNLAYLAKRTSLAFDATEAPNYPNGVTNAMVREEMGREQGRERPAKRKVLPIPESGKDYAKGLAEVSGQEVVEWIEKRPNSGKSFLQSSREATLDMIDRKYNFRVPREHRIKRIGRKLARIPRVVETDDDSTVKGNTQGGNPETGRLGINGKLAQEGVDTISRSGTPKITKECQKGLYTPEASLVALAPDGDDYRVKEDPEIAERLGSREIVYLSVPGMLNAIEKFTGRRDNVCLDCVGERHTAECGIRDQNETVSPITLFTKDMEPAVLASSKEDRAAD